MAQIVPPYLQSGDTIGFVAPSRKISLEEIKNAIDFFENRGFKVKLAENLFAVENQFAGSDSVRAASFQSLLDDDEVKALLAVRGGYGAVRVIDKIDFTKFRRNPKWLCGYSDFTVFHSEVSNFDIPTIHSVMPINFSDSEGEIANAESLLAALTGKPLSYNTIAHPLNRLGTAKAKVVGGNISILYSIIGSKSDISTEGKILFIEDLDEYLYHIDRMMMSLKRAGKLAGLAGLIVGDMSNMHDNTIPFGKNAEEIIADCCADYDFPICFNFPAGHAAKKLALRLGMEIEMHPSSGGFEIH